MLSGPVSGFCVRACVHVFPLCPGGRSLVHLWVYLASCPEWSKACSFLTLIILCNTVKSCDDVSLASCGQDFWSSLRSYIIGRAMKWCFWIIWPRWGMQREKSRAPNIDPWGTPDDIMADFWGIGPNIDSEGSVLNVWNSWVCTLH